MLSGYRWLPAVLVGALEAAAYTARDSFDAADRSTDRLE
jgi:hypothetical protein